MMQHDRHQRDSKGFGLPSVFQRILKQLPVTTHLIIRGCAIHDLLKMPRNRLMEAILAEFDLRSTEFSPNRIFFEQAIRDGSRIVQQDVNHGSVRDQQAGVFPETLLVIDDKGLSQIFPSRPQIRFQQVERVWTGPPQACWRECHFRDFTTEQSIMVEVVPIPRRFQLRPKRRRAIQIFETSCDQDLKGIPNLRRK